MNAHGVAIQSALGRPIMSSLHGGWSVGGFAAAGVVVLASSTGVDPRLESLLVGLTLLCVGLDHQEARRSAHSSSAGGLAIPSRAVILIGGLCFLVMLVEGGIEDWSGIYLRHETGASSAAAALAFTGFSLGMAVARLTGDLLNERLGVGTLCVAEWRSWRWRSAPCCSSARPFLP